MSEDITSEIYLYKRYLARFILVEANPKMIAPLRSQFRALNLDEARDLIVNTAVTKNTSGEVTFYCVDPRIHDDLPEPRRNAMWEWWTRIVNRGCSLSYERCYRGLAGQAHIEPFYPHLKPIESYITAEPVRGMTPGELLAHAGIGPADVDVLSIDAEGVSVELLNEFLLLDGFAPAFCSFEHYFEAVAGPGWDRFWGLWGRDSYILDRWTSAVA